MARVAIVSRQSPDWASMTWDVYRRESQKFCAVANYPDIMYSLARLWDCTFEVPYFAVRQKMKSIAESNWRQVWEAEIFLSDYGGPIALPGDAWVCLVDDDDWFCPDLPAQLPDVTCE